ISFVERRAAWLALTVRTHRDLSNEVIAAVPRLVLVAFHDRDRHRRPVRSIPKQFPRMKGPSHLKVANIESRQLARVRAAGGHHAIDLVFAAFRLFKATHALQYDLHPDLPRASLSNEFLRDYQNFMRAHTSVDRKSTRLNSSHVSISYAVFCLK